MVSGNLICIYATIKICCPCRVKKNETVNNVDSDGSYEARSNAMCLRSDP